MDDNLTKQTTTDITGGEEDKGMMKTYTLVLAGMAIAAFTAIYLLKKDYSGKQSADYKKIEHGQREETIKKIEKLLKEFQDDYKKYYIHKVFSWQLDVDNLKMEYQKNDVLKDKLWNIDNEDRFARDYKMQKTSEIAAENGYENKKVMPEDCTIFLINYHEIEAKKKALEEMESLTDNKAEWERFYQLNQEEKKRILEKYLI